MAAPYLPYLRDYKLSVEKPRAMVPLGTDPAIVAPKFVAMGFDGDPEDPATNFHLGWTLQAPAGSPLGTLSVPFTGSLSYSPTSTELTLWVTDPVFLNALRHLKPSWLMAPDRIVFQGIDLAELEAALRRQAVPHWEDFRSWEDLVTDLIAGTGHLPTLAGFQLAGPPSSDRTYTITAFDDTTDPNHPLVLNLSWYIEQWPHLFSGLAGHILEPMLAASDWPLWTSPNTNRYVKASGVTAAAHGGSSDDYFKDRKKPAKSLAEAIKYAKPNDVIFILDTSIYAEGEIVIDKPLAITGPSRANPLDDSFLPSHFPRLRPKGASGRVLRVDGSGGRIGPVSLYGLTIENGATTSNTPPTFVGGAGVAVVDEDQVYIERCCIQKNKTTVIPFGMVDLGPIKAKILGNLLAVSPIAVAPYLVALWGGVSGTIPNKVPNDQLGGQSFGGGLCFGWSDGWIRKSRINNNSASGRGNGIAVVGYGWPTIDACHVVNNVSGPSGRRDGGGIGIEVAIPEKLGRALTQQDLAADLEAWLDALTALDVAEIVVRFLGGLVLAEDLLPQICQAYIATRKWALWTKADVKLAQGSYVAVTNSIIKSNEVDDDGGGLYASVLSRLVLVDSTVEGNRANGGGGGVRTSMGSDIVIRSCTIAGNIAKGLVVIKGTRYPGAPGGGGLASRNTAVKISGTPEKPCTISGNKCVNFAGGGVMLEATSEGSMLIPNNEMWQSILTEVFDFDEMEVESKEGVIIEDNEALHNTTYHHPLPEPNGSQRGPHGWGGGLYIIRGQIDEVADIDVSIEDFAVAVRNNTAKAGALLGSNQQVRSVSTDLFRLVDLEDGVDDGDDQLTDYLDGTTFEYEGD